MGGLWFLYFASVCAFLALPSASFKNSMTRILSPSRQGSLSMVSKTILSATEETSFKVVSFNILAPCYNKLNKEHSVEGGATMEAEYEEKYMARNRAICDQLLQSDADII